MIEFKIITTPDKSQQATYQHAAKELVIGRTEGDMLVDDSSFQPSQLKIRVEEGGGATVENLAPQVESRLNGKPFSGTSPLKEKDNLTVGRTTINFSRLDSAPLTPPEAFVHPSASVRMVDGSKEKAMLDALEFLENQSPEGPTPGDAPLKPPSPGKPPLPSGTMPPPLPKRG